MVDEKGRLILQMKSEEWEGVFVDVADSDSVPDKSVLKVVVASILASGRTSEQLLKDKSARVTSKALSAVKKVSKPSGACAHILARMFPSSKPAPPQSGRDHFDPLDPCVASSAHTKKKASRSRNKASTITVILLPKSSKMSQELPKGTKRRKLTDDKRKEEVLLKRNMSPSEVTQSILAAFKFHSLQCYEYLHVVKGQLVVSHNQELGGEIVERRGAVYIREKDSQVITSDADLSSSSLHAPSSSQTSSLAFGRSHEHASTRIADNSESSSDDELPPAFSKKFVSAEVQNIEERERIDLVAFADDHEVTVDSYDTVQDLSGTLKQANDRREAFMQTLNVHPTGLPHVINRSNIFKDVIQLYKGKGESLLTEYPFRVRFQGELGIDVGDMFASFYEAAYEQSFDGSSLVCPVVHPEMDTLCLSVVGFVMSHGYIVTGILPNRIAFPSLCQFLLGDEAVLSNDILFESFLDSVSSHELTVIREAMLEVQQQRDSFSPNVRDTIVSLFSRYNSRQLPTPTTFKQMVINLAKYEFISKPAAAIMLLHKGVPKQHQPFWNEMGVNGLYELYKAQSVSSAMVLKMIENAEGANQSEERVLMYLRQFIGNIGRDELRNFLRFVTGSPVCLSLSISVSFNSLVGASRRPIAHTCTPSLVISSTYSTYQEFVSEFRSCLSSEYALKMDSC